MESSSSITPEIITTEDRVLTGFNMKMSAANNKTGELWKKMITSFTAGGFVPPVEKISLQEYPSNYFDRFDPTLQFTKWALVANDEELPGGFQEFRLKGGLYAVFTHIGTGTGIFSYIYSSWLPQSGYALDDRPHFEVLGEKYKNNDPSSEEKIWIPIRLDKTK